MSFNQPVKVGELNFDMNRDTGFHFSGASVNGKHHYSNAKRMQTDGYGQGTAVYEQDGEKLYIDFNINSRGNLARFGEPDSYIESGIGQCRLYKIKGDNGLSYYFLFSGYESNGFILFGKYGNGKFVKYVDSETVNANYFAQGGMTWIDYQGIQVSGNRLLITYRIMGKGTPVNGTLLLPWDENAQWFGISLQ
jgi:hypothetical protein